MADSGLGQRLKVFISYSRRDSSEFADELVSGLELAGFSPFMDRHDIVAGEDWEARLAGLIRQADSVVFVISPEAVKSERCAWEVKTALAQTTRVLPVIFKPVPESDIPETLRRRQFVRFDTGSGITRPLAQLAEALGEDIDWIREHTRLAELVRRWEARGRSESLLLRGEDLAAVQQWAGTRKPAAPAITDSMQAFIAASKEAEAVNNTRLKVTQLAQRRTLWMQALAGIFVAVIVAGIAAWWRQAWLKERIYELANVTTLPSQICMQFLKSGLGPTS